MSGWKTWCRAEILILRQCAGTMTVESIGSLIGRSEAAVRAKARDKGISLMLQGDFRLSAKLPYKAMDCLKRNGLIGAEIVYDDLA
ncbi:hypothetical protein BvCmsOUNP003_03050 [Escherichia coli]|nr:DNA-binding protein [Escherichia coli O22:H8]GCQ61081.1 hypothetical protein BvCmsHHP007_01080 [Escherichia coli]GDG09893.1 hypothetical protein BvCmsKKP001_01414 [Escherichia coli]GDG17381.1 hypothetical protein BvCmsKKP012_01201 [Escherichia coli]GDG18347.1 hypothetical protein BvCmsKKP043_01829 [Escherichia coli]